MFWDHIQHMSSMSWHCWSIYAIPFLKTVILGFELTVIVVRQSSQSNFVSNLPSRCITLWNLNTAFGSTPAICFCVWIFSLPTCPSARLHLCCVWSKSSIKPFKRQRGLCGGEQKVQMCFYELHNTADQSGNKGFLLRFTAFPCHDSHLEPYRIERLNRRCSLTDSGRRKQVWALQAATGSYGFHWTTSWRWQVM